ncbi:transketolase [Clostridium sp. YIM B02551]|uniref:transketolase n=1 Tax=Clostridium sp. YIM B02551 TaxID=2910679 RepID=UPI001EEC72DD|nr:transketolase [Clostridium sp. YIM B02551]
MQLEEKQLLNEISNNVRKSVVQMAYNAGSSHVASALSMVDILTVLYFKILNINLENYKSINRDKFILSKGHASSGIYAILAEKGFVDKEILKTYDEDGSLLSGHPKKGALPGIEASTGSLGHGLSIGCGLALSDKNSGRACKTVVLMGDGECNEGSVWESAMFASSKNLNNLIAIIDNNELQGLGKVSDITGLYPLNEKWKAFNWNVIEINGHDFHEILQALKESYELKTKPTVIIAHTIKGKGISFMENKLEWHYKSPNKEQFNTAMEELNSNCM